MFGQHVDICVSMPAKLAIPLSMFFCWHVLQPNCRCFTRPITDHYERNNGTNLLCDQTVTLSQFSFFFGILSSRFLLFASQYELVGLLSIGNLFILFFLWHPWSNLAVFSIYNRGESGGVTQMVWLQMTSVAYNLAEFARRASNRRASWKARDSSRPNP